MSVSMSRRPGHQYEPGSRSAAIYKNRVSSSRGVGRLSMSCMSLQHIANDKWQQSERERVARSRSLSRRCKPAIKFTLFSVASTQLCADGSVSSCGILRHSDMHADYC